MAKNIAIIKNFPKIEFLFENESKCRNFHLNQAKIASFSVKNDDFMHQNQGLHRCWRRMLETKCVGDNFEMLVTVSLSFNIIVEH